MDARASLQTALHHHQHGRLDQAERIYFQLARDDPNHATAWQLLAILSAQRGDGLLAAEYRRKSVAAGASEWSFHNNLGYALQSQKRLDEAAAAYRRALQLKPDFADACNNLGILEQQRGRLDESATHFRAAIERDPLDARFHNNLAFVLLRQGRREEALERFREVLRLKPGDEEAGYHLSVLTGGVAEAGAPRDYVARAFDAYAPTFDDHIVKNLGYRGPDLLREALGEWLGHASPKGLEILDLGCGTGLCGAALHEFARTLVGVDLSEEMIARARERGIYDRLIVADLMLPLQEAAAVRDLIVAGDVFNYLGDLTPVFQAVFAALRPGGRLAFTVEAHEGAGFTLQPTGRYTHSLEHVRHAAVAAGLLEQRVAKGTLRYERGQEVPTYVVVLGKPA